MPIARCGDKTVNDNAKKAEISNKHFVLRTLFCPWNEAGEYIITYYISTTKFTVGNKRRCEMRSAKIKCFQINRPGVLHKLNEEFSEPLVLILNNSWKNGKIPKGQKTASVSRY